MINNTLLLVDDDVDETELLTEGIHSVDHTIKCHVTNNGAEALNILQTIPAPDLIFVDINMPKMNGWEYLRHLQNHALYKEIPVIIYSTSSYQKDLEYATENGAWGFLTKPDDFEKLKAILHIVLKKRKEPWDTTLTLNLNTLI